MPRTLSGLRTGEFDTLEVSGQMIHSGDAAAQFGRLKVGDGPDEPTDSVNAGHTLVRPRKSV